MFNNVAFAMAPPPGAEPTAFDTFMSFAPMVLLLVIFYFLLIRPQQKKHEEAEDMIANLKEGDRVITSGGIIGTIRKIKNDEITLEVAQDVKIKIDHNYINGLVGSNKNNE